MADKKIKVGIFSTSDPLTREPKDDDYKFLKSKGIEIYEHPHVRIKNGHLAGTIEDRVKGMRDLLEDPTVDVLMAYWGGTNTNQVLPYLNYDLFKKYNKPIVGFSDTSALLTAVNKLAGIKTYMGPAGVTFDKPEPFDYSYEYLKRIVFDQEDAVEIVDSDTYADDLYFLRPDSDHRIIEKNTGRKVFNHGVAEAETFASNLQTLMILAGTPYFPDLTNKIVFLEEAESAGRAEVHRFFTHFCQVVDVTKLAGICIGKFASQTRFKDTDSEEMLYESLFKGLNIPIVYNLSFGHTDPLFTIALGGRAKIDTKAGKLILYR